MTLPLEHEQRLRAVIDDLDVVVWEGEADGSEGFRLGFVSSHAERMFGRHATAWSGAEELWWELIHAEDRPVVVRRRAGCLAAGSGWEHEFRVCAAGGEVRWVREIVQVSDAGDGGGPRRLSGVLVDVTAAREAEAGERARLHRSEQEARERMARLQAVTAAVSEALTPADVAAAVLTEGMSFIGASMAAIWQIDHDGTALELVGHRGWTERTNRTPMQRIEMGAPLPVPEAVRSRTPVWLPDRAAKAAAYPALASRAVGTSPEALYILPLTSGPGPVGAVALCFDDPALLDGETKAFAAALAAQCAQALQRARLFESEREVSVTLQRSLLPTRMPRAPGASFAVRYLPAAGLEAGGDFYEAIRLPSGAVGVAVGDVVGRGADAAATMGQLRAALRAYALGGDGPAAVLTRLSAFAETVDGGLAATAAYAVVDPRSGVLRYCCAGHPFPIVATPAGEARLLTDARSVPLGVTADPGYAEAEVALEPGATLLLFTDGLVERRGESVDDALEAVRGSLADLAAEPLPRVLDELVARRDVGTLHDDVALLAVRRSPVPDDARLTTFPAVPECVAGARAELRAWLNEAGVAADVALDVLLAAGEAVANAVEHAYADGTPGTVTLELQLGGGELELAVADQGRWRERPGDPDRGRGFTLMRALMDAVRVDRGEAGSRVVMQRRTAAPSQAVPGSAPSKNTAVVAATEITPDGRIVVALHGDLDLVTAPAAEARLIAHAGSGLLVADLGAVTHLDSSGLRVLVGVARRAGGRFTVVAPPGSPARRTIDVVGLAPLLRLRDHTG